MYKLWISVINLTAIVWSYDKINKEIKVFFGKLELEKFSCILFYNCTHFQIGVITGE